VALPLGRARLAYKPATHGIRRDRKYDRNRAGRLLSSYGGDRLRRENDVSLPPHKLGRYDRELIGLALQIVPLNQDIFALHISEVAQSLNERDVSIGGGNRAEQRQSR
jgi:hypothetical protein